MQGRGAAAGVLRTAFAVADREQTLHLTGLSPTDADRNPLQEARSEAREPDKRVDRARTLVQALDQGHEL